MRTLATVVCSLVMAFAAIGLAVAAPGRDHDPARAALDRASGALSIYNSHEAAALLQAANISPGWSLSGDVLIRNDGDVTGRFTLTKSAVPVDVPGPNGGRLSQRLVLEVDDITGGGSRAIFLGHPAEFAAYDLGTLAPNAQRSFRFTATLPNGGPSDNLFQGSSMSMGFAWRAVAPTPKPKPNPTPKPKPAPTATPAPTPAPAPARSLADQLGLPTASKCVRTSKMKFKLKAPAGTKLKSAVVTVNGKVKARLKGRKLKKTIKLRGLHKKTKLKVTVRTSARKTLKASRTYKACKKR